MSAPSIKLSISMLFLILHTLSVLTVPNTFLKNFLSKMLRLFSSFAVSVPVCDQFVTTGLIVVLYISILVFLFRSFDFISFELAYFALLPLLFFQQFLYSFHYLHSKCSSNISWHNIFRCDRWRFLRALLSYTN
jgi:hypothetical protein